MKKDWTGNSRSTFSTLGASSHSSYERANNDFYATDPKAIDPLVEMGAINNDMAIWEPSAGNGHLSERIKTLLPDAYVISSDIVQREYPLDRVEDFLNTQQGEWLGAIVTNPPYDQALEFIQKALSLVPDEGIVAMFLKITFLEGQKRKPFFISNPPKTVAVFSKRITCARNGEEEMFKKSSAACYAWFIWEKGYRGMPSIRWI